MTNINDDFATPDLRRLQLEDEREASRRADTDRFYTNLRQEREAREAALVKAEAERREWAGIVRETNRRAAVSQAKGDPTQHRISVVEDRLNALARQVADLQARIDLWDTSSLDPQPEQV